MEQAILGILIPFAGTSLGAACVYAMKQESPDSGYGRSGTVRKIRLRAGCGRVLAGYLTAPGSGPAGSAPAYVQREGRRAAQPFTAYNHARPGRDAA